MDSLKLLSDLTTRLRLQYCMKNHLMFTLDSAFMCCAQKIPSDTGRSESNLRNGDH